MHYRMFKNTADTASVLLLWKRKGFGKGKIDKATVFPTDFTKMRIYAPQLFVEKRGMYDYLPQPIYWSFFALPGVKQQLQPQPWLSSANNRLFRNILQIESTSEIGFFYTPVEK